MIVTKLTVAFGVVAYMTLWALAVTGLPFLIFYCCFLWCWWP